MNIIKNKYWFLTFSAFTLIAAVLAISFFGLKQGIDFTGGTLWEARFPASVTRAALETTITTDLKQTDASVTDNPSNRSFLIRLKEVSEVDHQKFLKIFQGKFSSVEELSFESVGSAIGQEVRQKALMAFLFVLLAISLYIAFAFRKVSQPVSSWKYALITLVTLFHDAIIPAGLFAYLGHIQGVEVGVNFIVAILVVIGFSVHDTIVVFDRIRENLRLERTVGAAHFPELVNRSINQTFARSLNTSLTLILVLLSLYFFGAASLHYFTLIILTGVIFGTYSSIFVASPLLVLWQKRRSIDGRN